MLGTHAPLIRPSGVSPVRPQTSVHAQNFSISALKQQEERAHATVSMNQAVHNRVYGSDTSIASSSIAHVMSGETKRFEDQPLLSEEQRDEIRTRLRYEHIRQMMRDKHTSEAEAVKNAQREGQDGIHINTGGTYSTSGWSGTKKTLKKVLRKGKYATYKNLSSADKAHLEEIIKEGSEHKYIGGGHSFSTKRSMGRQAWKKYTQGDISKEDYKDFKKIIRDLE